MLTKVSDVCLFVCAMIALTSATAPADLAHAYLLLGDVLVDLHETREAILAFKKVP